MKFTRFLFWLIFFVLVIFLALFYSFWSNEAYHEKSKNILVEERLKSFVLSRFLRCSDQGTSKYYSVGVKNNKTFSYFRFSDYELEIFDKSNTHKECAITIYKLEVYKDSKWEKCYSWWNKDSFTNFFSYNYSIDNHGGNIYQFILPAGYKYFTPEEFNCDKIPLN